MLFSNITYTSYLKNHLYLSIGCAVLLSWLFLEQCYAQQLHRSDVVEVIFSDNGGQWGSWQPPVYCPPMTYAVGYSMRVEPSQGSEDDTALNNIMLQCAFPNGAPSVRIESSGSPNYGWYGPMVYCKLGGFIDGFALQVEPELGPGVDDDDTAANGMIASCSDGGQIEVGGLWGVWGRMVKCRSGSAACGLQLKIEPPQGSYDDTAVNDVGLICCTR